MNVTFNFIEKRFCYNIELKKYISLWIAEYFSIINIYIYTLILIIYIYIILLIFHKYNKYNTQYISKKIA